MNMASHNTERRHGTICPIKRDRRLQVGQRGHNVTLRRVHATTVGVEKQYVLRILVRWVAQSV